MKQHSHSQSWRSRSLSQIAWIGPMLQRRPRWPVGLWLAGVVAATMLSLVPGNWISLTRHFPSMSSTVADVIEPLSHFFGLAVLVGFASLACRSWPNLIFLYIAGVVVGVVLETVQTLIPGRGASLSDLAMNVLGASAGFLFGVVRLKRKVRRSGIRV